MLIVPFVYDGYVKRSSSKSVDNIISSGTRIELQKSAIRGIFDHGIIIGGGLDLFKTEKYKYEFPKILDPIAAMSTHNVYVEIAYSLGLIGLFFFIRLFYQLISGLRKTSNKTVDKYGLMFGIVAYLIHALFDCNLLIPSFLLLLFFTISISFAALTNDYETQNLTT